MVGSVLETFCVRVTSFCNLACSHCRAGSSPERREYLDICEFKRFSGFLAQCGLKHVSISGGEPLLVRNVGSLARSLVDMGLRVTITTNGTVDPGRTDLSCLEEVSRHVRFRISLDGDKRTHEAIRGRRTFDRALRISKEISRCFGDIAYNTVVFPNQELQLKRLFNAVDFENVNEWAFISPVNQGSARNLKIDRSAYPAELNKAKALLEGESFVGRIKLWDFVNTPHSSLLIDAMGNAYLSGVDDSDDIFLVNIYWLEDVGPLLRSIEQQSGVVARSHFKR